MDSKETQHPYRMLINHQHLNKRKSLRKMRNEKVSAAQKDKRNNEKNYYK